MAEDIALIYTVREATKLLHLSRNGIYKAVSEGQIPHIRVGKRILIPKIALEQLLNEACKKSEVK